MAHIKALQAKFAVKTDLELMEGFDINQDLQEDEKEEEEEKKFLGYEGEQLFINKTERRNALYVDRKSKAGTMAFLDLIIYRKLLKKIDICASILGVGGVGFGLFENEILHRNNEFGQDYTSNWANFALRLLNSLATFILVCILIKRASIRWKCKKLRKARREQKNANGRNERGLGKTKKISFFKTKQFRNFVFELLFCLIHTPPIEAITITLYQQNVKIKFALSDFLTAIMIMRVYLIIRLVDYFSKFTSQKAKEYCRQQGAKANLHFALVGILKEKPYLVICGNILFSVFLFSFAVRIFEQAAYPTEPEDPDDLTFQNYGYLWNSFWLIFVTMTSVGYGDFFPVTHMGRIITCMSSLYGIASLSITIITLTNSSQLSEGESQSYYILTSVNARKKSRRTAAKIIASFYKLIILRKLIIKTSYYAEKERLIRKRSILQARFEYLKRKFKAIKQKYTRRYRTPINDILFSLTAKLSDDLNYVKEKIKLMTEIRTMITIIEEYQNIQSGCIRLSTAITGDVKKFIATGEQNFNLLKLRKHSRKELLKTLERRYSQQTDLQTPLKLEESFSPQTNHITIPIPIPILTPEVGEKQSFFISDSSIFDPSSILSPTKNILINQALQNYSENNQSSEQPQNQQNPNQNQLNAFLQQIETAEKAFRKETEKNSNENRRCSNAESEKHAKTRYSLSPHSVTPNHGSKRNLNANANGKDIGDEDFDATLEIHKKMEEESVYETLFSCEEVSSKDRKMKSTEPSNENEHNTLRDIQIEQDSTRGLVSPHVQLHDHIHYISPFQPNHLQ